MSLCRECDSFAELCMLVNDPHELPASWPSFGSVVSSAATCRLCQLIVSLSLGNFVDGRPDDRNLCLKILSVGDSTSKIYLELVTVCRRSEEPKLFLFAYVRFSLLHRIRSSGYLVRTRYLSSYVVIAVARFDNNTQGVYRYWRVMFAARNH
jgi:hypothetical protein